MIAAAKAKSVAVVKAVSAVVTAAAAGGALLALKLYKCEAGDEEEEEEEENEERQRGGGEYRPRRFRVTLFGVTAKGRTVCLRVSDFRPHFHVCLALPLTRERFETFVGWLRAEVCPSRRSFGGGFRPRGPPLPQGSAAARAAAAAAEGTTGGTTGGADPVADGDGRMTARIERQFVEETYSGEGDRAVIRLEFATDQLRKKALRFLRSPESRTPAALLYKSNGDSPCSVNSAELLTEVGASAERRGRGYETYGGKMPALHHFLHATGLQPTGWITARLTGPRTPTDVAWSVRCDAEYGVRCADLAGTPQRLDSVPMLVASYDCEMGSSHGDFPVPVKDYIRPASQFVEQCASHIHGTTPDAAAAFLRRALEHMFPLSSEAAAAAAAAEELPVDCVYPKDHHQPFDRSDPAARAAWVDAMVAILAGQPLSQLLAMPPERKRALLRTLRVAAQFENLRLQRQREQAAAEEAAAEGTDVAAGSAAEAAAAASEIALRADADGGDEVDDLAAGIGELGGLGGGGDDAQLPVEELLRNAGLDPGSTTFVDVLRASLDSDPAAVARRDRATALAGSKRFFGSEDGGGGGDLKLPRSAPAPSLPSSSMSRLPAVIAQQLKTQLLNQLLTLCLPPLEGDPITFIGTWFATEGGGGGAGEEEEHLVALGSCSAIPGATVYQAPDECALLLQWAAIMRQRAPHVLYTYNGFGFDNRYIFLRAREHGIADQVFAFGRRRGASGLVVDWRTSAEGLALSSCRLASGDYNMERPALEGVHQIDVMFYFRREHTSYTSYGLDAVAMANLTDSVRAMDVVRAADLRGKRNACDGSPMLLLDWPGEGGKGGKGSKGSKGGGEKGEEAGGGATEITTTTTTTTATTTVAMARPRARGARLLRLETGNITGLQAGGFVCLQLAHGQIAAEFLTEGAWRKACADPALAEPAEEEEEASASSSGGSSSGRAPLPPDAKHKVQVLGVQNDGKRQFLLVDALVADAVRLQIDEHETEQRALFGAASATVPAAQRRAEKAPAPLGDDIIAEPVPLLGATLSWSLVKDDVPPAEIFRLARGSAADRAVVGRYCLVDCQLPLVLARKLGVLAWYLETAALCCVDVSTLVFNGQGVKLQSYVGKACHANRTLLRDLEKEAVAYDGATVLEPRRDAYDDEPVAVNDFSSLYPSIMAAWNLSPGTRVWAVYYRLGNVPGPKGAKGPCLPFLDGGGLGAPFAYEGALRAKHSRRGQSPFLHHGLPGREYVYTWYTLKRRVPSPKGGKERSEPVGNKLVCWLLPNFADARHSAVSHPRDAGVYPQQALGLLSARQEKKKLQKQEGLDNFTRAVYKLQELVVKTSNNSVYGQLGSATSALRDLDVAASICSIGRLHIVYVKTLVERLYADRVVRVAPFGALRTRACYVYGDTDSVFFCFNLETLDPRAYPDAYVPQHPSSSSSSPVAAVWAPTRVRGRVALQCAIVLATNIARLVTDTGPQPMGLAYEKTMMKFFIVSKKKYAGFLFESSPEHGGKLKYMGLQVKKRDSCDCVRDVFGTVMARMLRDARDVAPLVQYLTAVVRSIVDGRLPTSKFLITKTLKSNYATPLQVPHNVLADRIEQRSPGTRPKPGDRVTYAFVVPPRGIVGLGKQGNLLAGQRIDTPEHIAAAGLRVDYEEYVRVHVMQPVVQLLSLLVDAVVEQAGSAQDRADLHEVHATAAAHAAAGNLEMFNAVMRSGSKRLVERIVFEPFLRELANRGRGLQDIAGFFGSAGAATTTTTVPELGQMVHRVPRPPAGAAKKKLGGEGGGAALQATMRQFFSVGAAGARK
jgi:DNA polymerase elongation subunit (family B)